jgi:K+-sensing histidine kinase KdpD
MSGFALGLIAGGFAGATGTLLLLLVVRSIPDGESIRSYMPERWNVVALIMGIMIVAGVFCSFVHQHLHRVPLLMLIFMLLVFFAAHVRGMLVAWIALAVATLELSVILPPANSFSIAHPRDQILLGFFVVCGVVGTRLLAQEQKA